MENKIYGRVFEARPLQTIPTKSGQQFLKRELVLDCTRYDSLTGERGYDNFVSVAFVQDKCALLDPLAPGTPVAVSIDISGRKDPNSDRYFNEIRGYKVEILRRGQERDTASLSEPQPVQQPASPQQAQAVPQPAAAVSPAPLGDPEPEQDGLPF